MRKNDPLKAQFTFSMALLFIYGLPLYDLREKKLTLW